MEPVLCVDGVGGAVLVMALIADTRPLSVFDFFLILGRLLGSGTCVKGAPHVTSGLCVVCVQQHCLKEKKEKGRWLEKVRDSLAFAPGRRF